MQGLLVGSEAEGSGGSKGRGLALGLFAALSLPLSTLAHLHLCQLDVPQHVGVCDGKTKRRRVGFSPGIQLSPIKAEKKTLMDL